MENINKNKIEKELEDVRMAIGRWASANKQRVRFVARFSSFEKDDISMGYGDIGDIKIILDSFTEQLEKNQTKDGEFVVW